MSVQSRTKIQSAYLRPETAQGIFTNYKNVVDSFYPDLPFGIGQRAKPFATKSARATLSSVREFEQMEIEYFVHPDEWEEDFEQWVTAHRMPVRKRLACQKTTFMSSKYQKTTALTTASAPSTSNSIFRIGREELLGLAYRTDFDLKNHQNASAARIWNTDQKMAASHSYRTSSNRASVSSVLSWLC